MRRSLISFAFATTFSLLAVLATALLARPDASAQGCPSGYTFSSRQHRCVRAASGPSCGASEHRSAGHCCAAGMEWLPARNSCICVDTATCGTPATPPPPPPTPTCPTGAHWSAERNGCVCIDSLPIWRASENRCVSPCPTNSTWSAARSECECGGSTPNWNAAHDGCIPSCVTGASWTDAQHACVCDTATPAWDETQSRCVAGGDGAATPAIVSGTLRVNTTPWSQVSVDGRLFGNTPQMNIVLTPGTHRVTMINPDFNIRVNRTVVIQPGQPTTLVLRIGAASAPPVPGPAPAPAPTGDLIDNPYR